MNGIPNPDIAVELVKRDGVLLHNDQPVTCPNCGSRPWQIELDGIIDRDAYPNAMLNVCPLRGDCGHVFVTCDDDEDEEDDDGAR